MQSILIIDDEPNIRRMLASLLRAEGYQVGMLSASPDGYNLYQRMGFREYGETHMYVRY